MIDEPPNASEITSDWLRAVILGKARLQHPDPSSVLLEQLLAHYNGLRDTEQLKFQQAIIDLLAAARASETHLLYHILHLVSYTKPAGGPVVLRKLIASRMLVYSPEAAAMGLESLAMAAQVEYGVPQWFAEFISRRLAEEPDARTTIAALEILAFQDEVELSAPIRRLCRLRDADRYKGEFLRSAFTALRRAGMIRFYTEMDASVLTELARDPATPANSFLQAFAAAVDRIGERDPGYFPLRTILSALLGAKTGQWLERCRSDMVMDIIHRIDTIQEAAGRPKLVVRPSTPPEYVDELTPPDALLRATDVKVFEGDAVRVLKAAGHEAEGLARTSRPTPISDEEAAATKRAAVALMTKLVLGASNNAYVH